MLITTAMKSSSLLSGRQERIPILRQIFLLKQGVRDMKGVEVISGGDYIISNATFPTYFIKGTDELAAQTKLDATVLQPGLLRPSTSASDLSGKNRQIKQHLLIIRQ